MPDPDLLIRTSGEMRLSNFLLWQIAYTEIFVTERLWPDFNGIHLLEAIADFQHRERRYGGLSDSVGEVEENPDKSRSWLTESFLPCISSSFINHQFASFRVCDPRRSSGHLHSLRGRARITGLE